MIEIQVLKLNFDESRFFIEFCDVVLYWALKIHYVGAGKSRRQA